MIVVRLFALFAFLISAHAFASIPAFQAKYLEDREGHRTLLEAGWSRANENTFQSSSFTETQSPVALDEGPASETQALKDSQTVIELLGRDDQAVMNVLKSRGVSGLSENLRLGNLLAPPSERASSDEVRTLYENGPVENRINLVFMGDGYVASERDKFFADVTRLAKEMFTSNTLHSYTPIFNVYAVFRASQESGLPILKPKNTAYQAYRFDASLRGVDATADGRQAVRESCHEAPGCDYPILIANDPYYGGLGGEVAISTSSAESGFKVLVHELGHTIGLVGEEYDGGGYAGANYSGDLDMLTWSQWLSGSLRAEPAFGRITAWPWQPLASGPFDMKFTSDGKEASAFLRVSGSGLRTPSSLQIFIDGQLIAQPFPGWADGDRQFYDFTLPGFSAGDHVVRFLATSPDSSTILSSVELTERAADFHDEPGYVGAFPVVTENNTTVGYRPTNETCLMRNMNSKSYCPICLENLWLKLFRKISLIDDLQVSAVDDFWKVDLRTPHLGQLRAEGAIPKEYLRVRWFFDGVEKPRYEGSFGLVLGKNAFTKTLDVEVSLLTPQVRRDPQELLIAKKTWSVPAAK